MTRKEIAVWTASPVVFQATLRPKTRLIPTPLRSRVVTASLSGCRIGWVWDHPLLAIRTNVSAFKAITPTTPSPASMATVRPSNRSREG